MNRLKKLLITRNYKYILYLISPNFSIYILGLIALLTPYVSRSCNFGHLTN